MIKRVGKRAYRYRVERERDPATGRSRARWIYLGIANPAERHGPDDAAPPARHPEPGEGRPRQTGTRERLLLAFERLAARETFANITAGAIAVEAGLAHGTFYRHFRDKRDLFGAAIERLRDDLNRTAPSFTPPYGSWDEERARVLGWLEVVFARKADRPGVLRAYYEALETDAPLRAERAIRRRERAAAFAAYLDALASAGTIAPLPSVAVATAILALVEAAVRGSAGDLGNDAITVAGVSAVVDRSLFG